MATPAAGGYYPPVGFHFKVEFVSLGNDNDQRFQSVTVASTLPPNWDISSHKKNPPWGRL